MIPKTAKLSKTLERELERIGADRVVVAAVLTLRTHALGRFSQLGLTEKQGKIVAGAPILPPPTLGLQARRNLDGWSTKRTDLPKEHRGLSTWAPSWNSGSFYLVNRDVLAYPLEHHPAKMLTISAAVIEHLVDGALVRFRVDQPLDRSASSFNADLQFNLRLLKEAVGSARNNPIADKESSLGNRNGRC